MGTVTKVGVPGALVTLGTNQEFVGQGNTGPGQDGNYRKIMVAGKLQTQKLISSVWTPMEEI